MAIPLKELYRCAYSKRRKEEIVITIDKKKSQKILKEVLNLLTGFLF